MTIPEELWVDCLVQSVPYKNGLLARYIPKDKRIWFHHLGQEISWIHLTEAHSWRRNSSTAHVGSYRFQHAFNAAAGRHAMIEIEEPAIEQIRSWALLLMIQEA